MFMYNKILLKGVAIVSVVHISPVYKDHKDLTLFYNP